MKWLFLLAISLQAGIEDDARGVLAGKCGACHGASAMGGLRLDSSEGFLKGGKSGRPAAEMVLRAVKGDGAKAMPPGGKLKADEIETLEKWIGRGANWPGDHWAWKPLGKAGGSIDSHINASLKAKGIQASAAADRRTLVRRLYFDLTGLPPMVEERDMKVGWQGRLVDKLLATAHFGEHWGRHWLDVARYGEDDFSGTAVQPYKNAWRYRDWVVAAVNRNLPYDRFLMAQLAGDRMGDASLLGGTGLTGLGPWYYGISQPPQARADERHDRVDVVSRGMLGVTLACARCHDHKYDPFSQKDYYALSGVFASTAYKEYPLVAEAEASAWRAKKKALDEAEKKLEKHLAGQADVLRERFAAETGRYMMASVTGDDTGLNAELLTRWCEYLKKPEDFHPYLKGWFEGPSLEKAKAFEALMVGVLAEKKVLDEENRIVVEAAAKVAEKPKRTIVLPGGYRSDEDFNPGADVPVRSLDRDKYVAYNRTFSEGGAPWRFPNELTAKLLKDRKTYEQLKADRDRLKKELPVQYAYLDGVGEFESWDLNLDKRGNPEDPGEIVPRRFPLVLSGGKTLPLNEGSGRLQLAETVAHHPLAARVAVNRIWMHLFGEGIVRTPSNFGLAGDRPGNPELVEYLAARFVESGYDTKAMVREIVLSAAYQRSADGDGENRLWWRQNRKRLAAEPLRDTMLAVSGRLDPKVGGASEELRPEMKRRTVYARVGRFQADETLSLFDLPNAAVTCEQRVVTNVPLQKLFYLNSEMVAVEAAALGVKLKKLGLERGYRLVFQRGPSETEKRAARAFLKSGGSWKQYAQVLLSTNEFSYVD